MYEFGPDEDEVVFQLARAMQNVGIFSLLGGMVTMVRVLLIGVLAILTGYVRIGSLSITAAVVDIVVAFMLISAGRTLMQIPRTTGDDMGHLMRGLSRFTTMMMLQIVLTAMALGFVIVIALWELP
jgi:hypothetical protein